MIKVHSIKFESVTFFLLAAIVGISFSVFFGHKTPGSRKFYIPAMQESQAPSPTPVVAPPLPKAVVTSQVSPDGTKNLTLTVTSHKDLSKTYAIASSDIDGTNKQTIYEMTSLDQSIGIPFNTWSPDNKYVFLNLTTPTKGIQDIVMNATGVPFSDTEKTFNISTLFDARDTGNAYQETTGWASETLLIVNANTSSGERQSYWFEVPSKAIIALSTQF